MKKLTPAQKEKWKPAHLPRHYYPGYVFIPKNGYFQARKIGLKADRVHRDPRFYKTRLLAKEFAQMAAHAKLIRTAFCTGTTIKGNAHRLHGLLNRILQEDESNICGNRKLLNGNLELLEGFNLNEKCAFQEACKMEWDMGFRPSSKQIVLTIPSFVPEYFILPPQGVSHCRIYMTTAVFDLDQNSYTTETGRTTLIPIKRIHFKATELVTSFTPGEGLLAITVLGISWYTTSTASAKLLPSSIPGPLAIMSVY
jgi:hypothetical protein